jgi:FGGY-family pentulose kinase
MNLSSSSSYVIGVDVGTGSARAGLFDLAGSRLALATHPIQMWKPQGEWAEQSSDDIWGAIGDVVRRVVAESGVPADKIIGIGYDATCSLVVLNVEGRPLSVSPDGDPQRNVIVWMDHRALAETDAINAGDYDVLRYVGGKISPEMEVPKLLWLKNHLPQTFARAARFFDLADYLSYQSTGGNIRSECTTVCKWTFLAHENRWDEAFFKKIGLPEFPDERIGLASDVRPLGSIAGRLTAAAAAHLSLAEGTSVAVGAIDAHAGGIGLLGGTWDKDAEPDTARLESALALIGGTSSCHMAVSREPRFIPGVWGPYFGAMVPGMWLTEGGQSASGALIDFAIDTHPASAELTQRAKAEGLTKYEILNERVEALSADLAHPALLARDLHVLDYHLGNRSPFADPRARGMVDGLGLDTSLDSLAVLYLATIQAVAYGTRAIIDALNAQGYAIDQILVTGGGTKNPLWLREHADATGATLRLPRESESVLLGAAILGAVASGGYPSIPAAMQAMAHTGESVAPNPAARALHDAKFRCYLGMYREQLERRRAMAEV